MPEVGFRVHLCRADVTGCLNDIRSSEKEAMTTFAVKIERRTSDPTTASRNIWRSSAMISLLLALDRERLANLYSGVCWT